MKIFIKAFFQIGGWGEHFFRPIVRLAVKRGHTVSMLTKSAECNEQVNLVRVPPLPMSTRWSSFLTALKSDLVHVNCALDGLEITLAKKLRQVPYIVTFHGCPRLGRIFYAWNTRLKAFWSAEERMIPTVCRDAFEITTISNFSAECLRRAFGLEPRVIVHGVDSERFKPDPNAPGKLRTKLTFNERDKIALWVGRFTPSKDPLTLIRAIPSVEMESPYVKFLLIGDGPLYEDMLKKSEEEKVRDRVRIIKSPVEKNLGLPIEECYAGADMLVHTAPYEAFGMVITEAMSSGLPVVCTRTGAPSEIVGNCGLYFGAGDHYELAEKIKQLLLDDEARLELGERARKHVISRFRWGVAAKQYVDLYEEAVASR